MSAVYQSLLLVLQLLLAYSYVSLNELIISHRFFLFINRKYLFYEFPNLEKPKIVAMRNEFSDLFRCECIFSEFRLGHPSG